MVKATMKRWWKWVLGGATGGLVAAALVAGTVAWRLSTLPTDQVQDLARTLAAEHEAMWASVWGSASAWVPDITNLGVSNCVSCAVSDRGASSGTECGVRLRSAMTWRGVQVVDSAAGAALNVVALAVVLWIIATAVGLDFSCFACGGVPLGQRVSHQR